VEKEEKGLRITCVSVDGKEGKEVPSLLNQHCVVERTTENKRVGSRDCRSKTLWGDQVYYRVGPVAGIRKKYEGTREARGGDGIASKGTNLGGRASALIIGLKMEEDSPGKKKKREENWSGDGERN